MTTIWLKKKKESQSRASKLFFKFINLRGVTSKAERLRHLVLFFFQFSLSCLQYQRCGGDFLREDTQSLPPKHTKLKHNFVVQTVLLIRVQCCKDLLHKRGNSALPQHQQTTHSLLSCCCLQNPKCSYCSHHQSLVRVFVFCVILYLAKKEKTCKFRNRSLCLGLN